MGLVNGQLKDIFELRSRLIVNEARKRESRIRPYQKSDRRAIIQICHATGYMGGDVSFYFFDRKLFALMNALYYVDYEPENCFIAEVEGQAMGYIVGTKDTSHQRKRFLLRVAWKIIFRFLFCTILCYQRDIKTLFQILYRHLRRREVFLYFSSLEQRQNGTIKQKIKAEWQEGRFKSLTNSFTLLGSSLPENEINQQYPAHLHINLLEEAQGLGLGSQLLRAFEAHLVANNVRGYHLQTTDYNSKAIPFYFKNSLEILSIKITPFPWPNVLSRTLIFGKKLQDIDLNPF